MSLNEVFVFPINRYWTYDGTNGQEIVDALNHPEDQDGRELTVTIEAEDDGVLVINGLGCFRNTTTHAIEITTWNGPMTFNAGDLIRGNDPFGMQVDKIPAALIGDTYGIYEV